MDVSIASATRRRLPPRRSPTRMNNESVVRNDFRCCAERNLIASKVREAGRHGVPRSGTVHWIRRKYGKDVSVWRTIRSDDSSVRFGCCVPCVACRRTLVAFGFVVHVPTGPDSWYHGRLTDDGAPVSKPTSEQCRVWRKTAAGV